MIRAKSLMRMQISWVLVCALGLAAENPEASKNEMAQFEGVWSFARIEVDGVKQPNPPFATHKLIITRNGNYVILQGERITRGMLNLDPTKTPKHYTVRITTGAAKGMVSQGIYALDGDTYTVSLPLKGKERPTSLESKPGGGCLVTQFQREKQGVKEALTPVGRYDLAGQWQALTYSLNGTKATEEEMAKIKLIIDADGKTRATNEGRVFIASTIKIDPTIEPMTIDLTFTEGDFKGQTSLGIYKIEDDLLTICRSAPDQPRPTKFASDAGGGLTLMSYQKIKSARK